MRFHLSLVSENRKTGPMPVSMSSKETCPDSCPMKNNGCYASSGVLNIHWLRLNQKGLTFNEFLAKITLIQPGNIWRMNQAGDLMGENEAINVPMLRKLIKANKGKRGFTYTHKNVITNKKNRAAVKEANKNGFTINLSANNLEHADKLKKLNIGPVVTILPIKSKKTLFTPQGNKVIVCPATYKEGVTCLSCQLCQKKDRTILIGFPSHGMAKKRVEAVFTAFQKVEQKS